MISLPLPFTENELGWSFENEKLVLHFGGIHASKEALSKRYPYLSLRQTRQVHGNVVLDDVGQDLTGLESDGLVSNVLNQALCILTADCVPILIYDEAHQRIAALHAGWRGVANRILPTALAGFAAPQDLTIWIGPHIQQPSFEIRDDAYDLIKASSTLPPAHFTKSTGPGSFRVDLHQVLLAQAKEFGIPHEKIQALGLDSKTDLRLHSFRRDAKEAGRQTSFIALKK